MLLVVADATTSPDAAIQQAARRAFASGACFLCAWGPDCEREGRPETRSEVSPDDRMAGPTPVGGPWLGRGVVVTLDCSENAAAEHTDPRRQRQARGADGKPRSGFPAAPRVHDLFDGVIVDEGLEGASDDDVIMTTWHASESLEEAIRFFLVAAGPPEAHRATCRARVAVVVGPPDDLAARVRRALADPAATLAASESADDDEGD